ncbi:MAG: hypothetical protein J2P45_21925 [Candidatus Dormibacteraeota bacterium]|nr:hypothetical protein [Candidatus Dormibacteraeota bacterium]
MLVELPGALVQPAFARIHGLLCRVHASLALIGGSLALVGGMFPIIEIRWLLLRRLLAPFHIRVVPGTPREICRAVHASKVRTSACSRNLRRHCGCLDVLLSAPDRPRDRRQRQES